MPTFLLRPLGWLSLLVLPAMLLFSSCASTRYYNQRTMFRLTDDGKDSQLDTTKLRIAVNRTARNYLIQPNDYLEVRVYTNKGERILDPNGELQFGQPGGAGAPSINRSSGGGQRSGGGSGGSGGNQRNTGAGAGSTTGGAEFLVQADGYVVIPMVNRVKVSGLSLLQADSVLKQRYTEFYKEPFVMTHVTNNRVFVLGAPGGQVIPLNNDNMNLLEILALAGGVDGGSAGGTLYRNGGRTTNIRIIRGDLKNPQVQQIDLSTLDGMRRGNLQMEPNDIVYIEPVRRRFLDGFVDAGPVLSATALLLNATVLIINIVLR